MTGFGNQWLQNGIACVGDSLTEGFGGGGVSYPAVLEEKIREMLKKTGKAEGREAAESKTAERKTAEKGLSGLSADEDSYRVENLGVCGEDTFTILGRSGALPFVLEEAVRIPAGREKIPVPLKCPLCSETCLLVYGNAGVNPVRIGGAEGRLTLRGAYFNEQYYFERTDGGEALTVPAGTKIETRAMRECRKLLPVVLMGANGFFENAEDLILQHRTLLSFYAAPEKEALVLGMPIRSRREMRDLEEAMAAAFGDRYVNLREYLSTRGLADAGLSPTERDRRDMEAGRVPESLRSDEVHLNRYGYRVMGELVFRKLFPAEEG